MADDIKPLIDKLEKTLESCGLYVEAATLMTDNPNAAQQLASSSGLKEMIDDGNTYVIGVEARVNDYAFSDNVLYPDRVEETKKLQELLPDEINMIIDRFANPDEDDWLSDL